MIDHLSTYASDFSAAKSFYDAVLPSLGYPIQMEMVTTWDEAFPTRRLAAYGPERPVFWLVESPDEPATPRHVAFVAHEREAVDRFWNNGIAAGARDNGAPGPRPHYHEHYYGAFLLDPDGNNVEAVCHRRAPDDAR